MSRKNTIPEFTDDPRSVVTTLRVMKELMEGLLGRRRGQGQGAPFMFYQIQRPESRAGAELEPGDLWIQPAEHKLRFWTGSIWQDFAP